MPNSAEAPAALDGIVQSALEARTRADVRYGEYRQRRMFANLDGLRAICILAVIFHHTVARLPGLTLGRRGYLGVDMFFVLSGFLIVTLLLREREKSGDISLKNFYVRRTLRIFPLYYLVLGVVLLASLTRDGGAFPLQPYLRALPYLATYTTNWVPHMGGLTLAIAWSLAVEEQFYLVWPPVERFLKRAILPVWILLFALSEAVNFDLLGPFGHLNRYNTPMLAVTFGPILLGVALAHALHDPRWFSRLAPILGGRHAAALFGVGVLLLANIPHDDIGGWHRLSIHVLMTLALGSLVLREDTRLGRMLRTRPLVRMGQVSYGMYLWHQIARSLVFMALAKVGMSELKWLLFIGTVAAVYLLSELSFRFFESPFLKLKARFA